MNRLIRKILITSLVSVILLAKPLLSKSEGISVDAGLTPAQDRIVIRAQYRYIINKMNNNEMSMHVMPLVIAYGLSPDITLMMRNGYRAVGSNETMMKMENMWMDPFLMGKVKLFRLNTRSYSFGIAGFVGSSLPVLRSSEAKTYSPTTGINASFRPGEWSFDLNNAYEWVNYDAGDKRSESRQFQMNLAISRNLEIPGINNVIISPVQEFSFVNSRLPATDDTKRFGFLSPGMQIVSPHFKFEILYQIGLNESNADFKYGNRFIMGFRLLL